jgi:M6 family metalloprotease-like protein
MRQLLLTVFLFSLFSPLYAYQTIKVAAIRVEFQTDDNSLTTGDGTFRLNPSSGIDPAPHNRTYFKDQIIAADNYFNFVSAGNVRVTGDVFPKGMNNAYVLSNEMNHYNPNTTQEEINKGIASLFVDAVQLADSDPDWDYADYDLVVVFHAGVGKDIDVGFDETPQDISSLFVTRQFLQDNWNSSFDGIAVDNGSHSVEKGIILPETENQQDIQIALTGMFVSNIGSYLGLYDLFSAAEQRSGIGQFGLMDAGLVNFNGLIPAPPSAFHRKLLGWDTPFILDSPVNNQRIANKYSANAVDPALIEIPINEDEYYLIEYRGLKKENVDSLLFELSDERDSLASYLDLLKEYFPQRIHISDSSGVLLSVDNYDFGIPGVGILIWHIDESVIRNSQNRLINDDPSWRAVDLEEADGSQDIGEEYNILQTGSELGWLFDFWHANNDAPLYENEFSSSTIPNTRSNLNRAETGIVLNNFSTYSNDYMTFNYNRAYFENGFPVALNLPGTSTYTISGIPVGKENAFVFALNDNGDVFAVGAQGKGLFYDEKYLIGRVDANGTGTFSMALADTSTDGIYDELLVMSNGTLYGFDLSSHGTDSLATEIFKAQDGITQAINSPLVVSGNQIFFVDGINYQSFLTDGSPVQTPQPLPVEMNDLLISDNIPLAAGFKIDFLTKISPEEFVSADIEDSNTEFTIYNLADEKIEKTFIADEIVGQFSVADIDGNGSTDIVHISKNRLSVNNLNGSPLSNFPVQPVLSPSEELVGTPLIVDLSGQGDIIIIFSTNKGQITAFTKDGKVAQGFPLSAGGVISAAALVLQLDNDSALELAAVSNSANISVWEIPGSNSASKIIWGSANLNSQNNAVFQEVYTVHQVGKGLLPTSRFFNYPNPNKAGFTTIRYYLNEDADVTIRIFDTAGYKVDQFSGPGVANTTNEIVWNVDNFSSGVYVCQLEAVSENYSERKLIKIMVVH